MPEIILWLVTLTDRHGVTHTREVIAYEDCTFGKELDYDTKRAFKYAGINVTNKGFELKDYKFKQSTISRHGKSNELMDTNTNLR